MIVPVMAPNDHPGGPPDGHTYLFLHIMKTGGTSLLRHLADNFGATAVDPPQHLLRTPSDPSGYSSLRRLRDLGADRRAEVRVYAGHYPYLVVDLVNPTATFTILRDPIERAISLLKQAQRGREPFIGRPLEEIYEAPEVGPSLVINYQVKLFAMSAEDLDRHRELCLGLFGPRDSDPADQPHSIALEIDQAHVDLAVARLSEVTVFGFQSRYDEVIDELQRQFRWHLPNEHRVRRAPAADVVPPSFRARLEEELAADVEFYRRAEELHEQRRHTGRTA